MLRSGPVRSLARFTIPSSTYPGSCKASTLALPASKLSFPRIESIKRPRSLALTAYRPLPTSLQRWASTTSGPPFVEPDKKELKHEKTVAKEELEPHPEEVNSASSVHQIFHEKGTPDEEKDEDMLAGVYADLRVIKETFALNEVPREAFFIGLAGLLPYAATSLSTVYLAWDINHAALSGQGFLLSGESAELLLHIIEPLQMGYGAVILSFLGAIHWGLEWAKYGGVHGYRRYAYGVVAPAVAWPTLLLPVEYALIAQFSAFTFLYFADARAVVKGWAPPWYSTYRFVLTFIVGASIVITLIGRGQIVDKINRLPGPGDRLKQLRESQVAALEQEEQERRARVVAQDEAEEEEEEDDD
ncbi:MAG: hypothetical protein L6R35_006741 [Caloplaca aegaea]|nr:MAG: hypothetical protein L6R35_006741 [Caloplaca aegaea]